MKKYLGIAFLAALLAGGAVAQHVPAQQARPSRAARQHPAPAKKSKAAASAKNQVWVNGKVYHCPGSRHFGKTKNGEYMTEKAAIAAGAKASRNRPCA